LGGSNWKPLELISVSRFLAYVTHIVPHNDAVHLVCVNLKP